MKCSVHRRIRTRPEFDGLPAMTTASEELSRQQRIA
jgi:hypothetical protein